MIIQIYLIFYLYTMFYVNDAISKNTSTSLNDEQLSASSSFTQPTITTNNKNLDYCQHGYYNSHTFNKQDIDKLKTLRITSPKKICNPNDIKNRRFEWDRISMDNLPNNMVSFVNRCKLNIFTDTENQEFAQAFSNNELTYNHVYKCGGTTIWNALDTMQKDEMLNGHGIKYKLHKNDSFLLQDNKYYWDHQEYFYNYWNHNFLFTYVRDPIGRSLSGYYEMAVKDTKLLNQVLQKKDDDHDDDDDDISFKNIDGINGYRLLMNHMLNWKCNRLNILYDINRRKKQYIHNVWTGDPHIHPQMIHLLNRTFQWFPYNYIGDLKQFDISFKQILNEFSDKYHNNKTLYDKYVHRARNRQTGDYGNVLKSQVITINDLSDDDIKKVCEIYWIDYLCLPYDIPQQCNITDLFVRHYGDDVTYMDCYYV